jgi:4-amino-4-deoxy-L-arabinose transferase-like glycosyltransferase
MATKPRRDEHRRWTQFVLFAGFVSLVLIHGPLIGYKTYANVDEAYAAALAERLTEGYKLYQGAVSQRGPLMYYIFEALDRIDGWDNILALRLWALALAIAHLGFVYWAGRKLLSKSAATIAVALSAYALAFGFPPEDAVAINGEPLQLPALMIAVVLGVSAVRAAPGSKERTRYLLWTGLCLGIAIAIKQSVALHPLPILLYLAVDAHRRRQPLRRFFTDAALLFGATLVVPLLFVLNSAIEGTLKDFYYYCVTYNSQVHLRPSPKHFTWLPTFFFRLSLQTLFFIAVVLLFGGGLAYARRRIRAARAASTYVEKFWALVRGYGPREYLAFHLTLALFSATVMYRFFPHYYLQALPFMSLCGAGVLSRFAGRGERGWTMRATTVSFMCFVLFTSALGCDFGEKVDGRVSHDRSVTDIAKLITATTTPDDKIFVWGFSPWIYGYSHRRAAGRYVFETYVTGFVPWFWEKLSLEKSRIVPGSTEALLDDLDHEKPAIVVDAGAVMMGRPMRAYEKPNAWLHAHYCFDVRIGALDVYRRKADGATCDVPFFPRAHEVVDYRGAQLPIPIPRTIDYDTSPPLPQGSFFKPLYFLGYKQPQGLEAIRDRKREREEKEGADEGFTVIDIESPIEAAKALGHEKTGTEP